MSTFLSAEWKKLVMANYQVDPVLLRPYIPHRTELDLWNNHCYVSLVGFMFLNTRVRGIKIPFHTNFEEVNLRFYVKHKSGNEWRRGVVFIKEIVPCTALSLVANLVYGEHYKTLPMKHEWNRTNQKLTVKYSWKQGDWHSISVTVKNELADIAEGSEEEFITEHYWGYTKLSETKTSEYGVEHPRWKIYPMIESSVYVDFERVYGNHFQSLNTVKPVSVFLAEGSEIKVLSGQVMDPWI